MNNELIKIITNEEGQQLVSARELYEGLKVSQRFNDWITRRISKYGFEENVDYTILWSDSKNGNAVNYLGSPQKMAAKELCMIQRNELGRKFRKYFIECEKKLKEIQKPQLTKEQELQKSPCLDCSNRKVATPLHKIEFLCKC